MEPTIPVHYHQLPLITGTDIVYEEALPLWDMNAKRIVVGDGVTPGGVLIPNFNDDLSYVRKFILADTTAAIKDWLICTTSLTVNLPSDVSAMAVVRISTLVGAEPVTVKAGDTVVLSMGSSTTVELVYGESGWVITENTSAASDMGGYLKKEALMLNGAAAQLVSFKSMTQADYDLITPVIDAIYFIRDTRKLIFNGIVYGSGGGGGGEPGVSTYLYVAYAADDTGSGFSLVPTDDLPYRAEIHVHVEIQNPTLSDFADAVWIKYIATGGGSGGGGTPSQAFTKADVTVESTGDNQNAAYLTLSTLLTVVGILDNEGVQWNLPSGAVKRSDTSTVVDISSVLADKGITADKISGIWYVLFAAGEGGSSGGSVSWGDVTGKPSTYPPATHTHEISQVDGLQYALDNAGKVKSVNGQLPDENGNITIEAGEGTVKSVNGVLPDASGNVTIETGSSVDESRLLPANAADRDIPIFNATSTVGGGNDETTKFLIQIHAGGSLITDTAAGNATPVPIENNGVSVNAAGAMVFNGSGYLKIAANTLPADLMGQDMDYTIDILYTATSKDIQCLFGRGDSPRIDFLLRNSGTLEIGGGPNLGSGWPFDTEVLLTFECWKEGTAWRYTCYRDGAVVTSGTWGSSNWRGSDMWIGWEGYTGGRELTGQIKALRLSNTALHKGTAFSPDYPWSVPEVVGEWGTLNESTLVTQDSNRLLPAPDTVPSDNLGNPVIFKVASRIDNTYLLCFPFNEDARDRSLYNVDISVDGVIGRSDLAPAAPGGSLYMSGRGCVHGTLPVMLGTLDFTVRFWIMAPGLSSSSFPLTIFSTRQGNITNGNTFALHCTAEGRLYVYSNTNITSNTDTPFTLQAGVWYHIAVVRSSGIITIYVNGQTYTSGTFTNNLTRQIFGIGASWTGSDYQEAGIGHLTSLDVLNYAVYTGPFEVPEYKAGVPSDMKYMVASSDEVKDLLTKAGLELTQHTHSNKTTLDKFSEADGALTFNGAPISSGNEIPTNRILPDPENLAENLLGGPVVFTATNTTGETYILRFPFVDDLNDHSKNSIAVSKIGTVSLAGESPDGAGGKSARFERKSCLYGTLPVAFGTGDFTINLWLKTDSIGTQTIFSTREGNSTSGNTFALMLSNNKNLYVYADGDKTQDNAVTSWTANAWHHIRLVRASGALTIMLDGSVNATGTMANDITKMVFAIGGSYGGGNVYESTSGCYVAALEVLNYAMSTDAFSPGYVPGTLTGRGYAVSALGEFRTSIGLLDNDFVQQAITTPGEVAISTDNGFCQFCEITSTNVSAGNFTFTLPELSIEHPEMEIALKISTSCTLSAKKSGGASAYVFHTENEATTENVLHYIMHVKYVNGNTMFTFEKLWAI